MRVVVAATTLFVAMITLEDLAQTRDSYGDGPRYYIGDP